MSADPYTTIDFRVNMETNGILNRFRVNPFSHMSIELFNIITTSTWHDKILEFWK